MSSEVVAVNDAGGMIAIINETDDEAVVVCRESAWNIYWQLHDILHRKGE